MSFVKDMQNSQAIVEVKKKKEKKRQMNQRQMEAFIAYWALGADRSLLKLRQQWAIILPKNGSVPCLETLKNWSVWFNWQEELKRRDDDVNKQLIEEAVNAAHDTRIDILKVFRAVVIRFAKQLRDDPTKDMNSFDVATFWRMARIEMGLPADSSKQIHELGDSFFDLMKERHDRWSRQNNNGEKNKLGDGGEGEATDS